MIRTYTELMSLKTFDERFEYVRLKGKVGAVTFGFERWLNQKWYNHRSNSEWSDIRDYVIARDLGRDLGMPGYEIAEGTPIYVHHMNPVTTIDIVEHSDYLTNPEYLICTSFGTHQNIHYSRLTIPSHGIIERRPNDTCPWKH